MLPLVLPRLPVLVLSVLLVIDVVVVESVMLAFVGGPPAPKLVVAELGEHAARDRAESAVVMAFMAPPSLNESAAADQQSDRVPCLGIAGVELQERDVLPVCRSVGAEAGAVIFDSLLASCPRSRVSSSPLEASLICRYDGVAPRSHLRPGFLQDFLRAEISQSCPSWVLLPGGTPWTRPPPFGEKS